MKAMLFAAMLSALLGIPAYFYAKKADKRGLILIAAFVLLAIDAWVVQSARVLNAITYGGKLADLAIIHLGTTHIGSLDIALAVMLIAMIVALTKRWTSVLVVTLVEFYFFKVGLFIAMILEKPVPGAFFIILGISPFLVLLKPRWKEMPRSDQKTVAGICITCCMIATAGLIHAILVSA